MPDFAKSFGLVSTYPTCTRSLRTERGGRGRVATACDQLSATSVPTKIGRLIAALLPLDISPLSFFPNVLRRPLLGTCSPPVVASMGRERERSEKGRERKFFTLRSRSRTERLLGVPPLPGGGAAHLVPTTGTGDETGHAVVCVVPLVPKSSRTHVARGTRVTRHTSAATRPVHTPASAPRFAPPCVQYRRVSTLPRVQHATASLLWKQRHVKITIAPFDGTSSSFDRPRIGTRYVPYSHLNLEEKF